MLEVIGGGNRMTQAYYKDDWVTIYNEDFRNAEWLVSDKAYLITDPPYGIKYNPHWLADRNLVAGKPLSKIDCLVTGDDGSLDLSILFDFPRRLIWGFPYIYDSKATGWLIWDKQPGLDTRGLVTPVEMAATTLWTGFRMVRAMWGGYYKDNNEKRYEHPTQKPLKVFLQPIADYTKLNDLVIDPFLGSGTCAVAAKKLNRRFIGYEIEEKYCEIAANRCRQSAMVLEEVIG